MGVGTLIGTWFAGFLTLAILSFLYKDNPFYKFAEHLFVGVSAAYWMVVAWHTTLMPNLFAKLWPHWQLREPLKNPLGWKAEVGNHDR